MLNCDGCNINMLKNKMKKSVFVKNIKFDDYSFSTLFILFVHFDKNLIFR